MSVANLIPEYIPAGKSTQEIVIEYSIDLPPTLMTLAIFNSETGEEIGRRIPTNGLGPRTVKTTLPSFEQYGMYDVIQRFPATEDLKFPPFQLRVLSPVETLMDTLVPEEDPYNATKSQTTNAIVAALFAFLIQNEQQCLPEDNQMIDQVLSQILGNMDKPVISLSEFLCGQYITNGETLLHFCIRHNYTATTDFLYHYMHTKALQQSIAMKGFDGNTPTELASKLRLHGLASQLESASSKSVDSQDTTIYEEKKPYRLPSSKTGKKIKTKFFQIGKAIRNAMPKSEEETSEEGAVQDKLLLQRLRDTALYSAKVLKAYDEVDKCFGTVSLKVGDIAYVTREEDRHWCIAVVNQKLQRIPRNILQPRSNNKKAHGLELATKAQQHAQNMDEIKERQEQKVKRPPLPPPGVMRSYSVETGLDEISNKSLLKRNPLPMNQTPTCTHRDIPVPRPPDDDSSDGDDYEPMVFSKAPKFTLAGFNQSQVHPSQLHSPQLRPPIKINPNDSPVLRRKQNKLPIPPPAKTSDDKNPRNRQARMETCITEKRGSFQSTTSRDSGVSDSNRDSIVSNKSIQSSNRGSTISNISVKNADPNRQTVTGPSKSSTTASSKASNSSIEKVVPGIKRESIASNTSETTECDDSESTYDDVATLLEKNQKAVELIDEPAEADSDYVNVGIYGTRNRLLPKVNPINKSQSTESNESMTSPVKRDNVASKNSQLPLSVKQQPNTGKQDPSPPKQSLETVPSRNQNSQVVEIEKSTNETDFDYVNVSINAPGGQNRMLPKVKPKPAIHQQTSQSNDSKTSLDESDATTSKRADCDSPKLPTKQRTETNKEVPLPPNRRDTTVLTRPANSPRTSKGKVPPPTPPKKPGPSEGGNTGGHYSPVILSLKTAPPVLTRIPKTMDKEGQGGKRQSTDDEEPDTKSVKDLHAMFDNLTK